jgi:hypothetical protein
MSIEKDFENVTVEEQKMNKAVRQFSVEETEDKK